MSRREWAAVALVVAGWLLLLWALGLGRATMTSGESVVSYTFDGWDRFPVETHRFLGQYEPDDLATGQAYHHCPYVYIVGTWVLLAPVHFALGATWELAQNVLPWLDVLALALVLAWGARGALAEIARSGCPFQWALAAVAVGLVVTCPFPWVSSLEYRGFNWYATVMAVWCLLSLGEPSLRRMLLGGLFYALWAPQLTPAWALGMLWWFQDRLPPRRLLATILGVAALAATQYFLPSLMCRMAGLKPIGSPFLYRTGLNGSTEFFTDIVQAVVDPVRARPWPLSPWLGTVALALLVLKDAGQAGGRRADAGPTTGRRADAPPATERRAGAPPTRERRADARLRQAGFLLLPYATLAILFPQAVSIHPYHYDVLLGVPATFALASWSLDQHARLRGPAFAGWLVAAGFVLMSNLLVVAQGFR